MCTGMEIAALVSAGSSLMGAGSSLFGGGKGKEIPVKQAISPEQEKMQKFLSKYLMGNIGKTQYAPINPLSLGGMDVASRHYLGQPYQQPQIQQYTNPNIPQMPMGGGGAPQSGGGGWDPNRPLGDFSSPLGGMGAGLGLGANLLFNMFAKKKKK